MVATRALSSSEITVELGSEIFTPHNFEAPGTTVTTNKEELIGFLKEMYTMRRMEITNDTEYKVGPFSVNSMVEHKKPRRTFALRINFTVTDIFFAYNYVQFHNRRVISVAFAICMMGKKLLPVVWRLP